MRGLPRFEEGGCRVIRLDTYARLMAESKAGKPVEPGKPDDSLFLELIEQVEPTGRMPKNADPLPDA